MNRQSLLLVAIMLTACSDGKATDTSEGTAQELRAPNPNEVIGPAPSNATAFQYDGTTLYKALSFQVTTESDVVATLAARTPGRQVVAWMTRKDGTALASGLAAATLSLNARLQVGDYYLVFRDANRLASTVEVELLVKPVVVLPPPPPPPPPPEPSFLLPPGINGATVQAEFRCDGMVEYALSFGMPPQYGKSPIGTKTTCSGVLRERNLGGVRDLHFEKVGTCIQTKVFDSAIVSDIMGGEEILNTWTYSLSEDAYVFQRGPTLSAQLSIAPTFATGSILVPQATLSLLSVQPKVWVRPDTTRMNQCSVRFSF